MAVLYPQYSEKYGLFSAFSLAESMSKAFIGYSFGASRKKASILFYGTAIAKVDILFQAIHDRY